MLSIATKLIILCSMLSACTWVSTTKRVQVLHKDGHIDTNSTFYVIYPKDGMNRKSLGLSSIVSSFKDIATGSTSSPLEENHDSAREVMTVFRSRIGNGLKHVAFSEKNMSLQEGFKEAALRGDQYMINIDINEWSNPSYFTCRGIYGDGSRMSHPPLDVADLTIFIYDVKMQTLVNRQNLHSDGCPIVFLSAIPFGKNSPSGRLYPILKDWLQHLD